MVLLLRRIAMSLDQLIADKNDALLRLEQLKLLKPKRDALVLASRVAVLETRVAQGYLRLGSDEAAAVNFVSAAACFLDCNRVQEAKRAYMNAKALTFAAPQQQLWINEQLRGLDAVPLPGDAFNVDQANLDGNDRIRRPQIEAYHALHEHFSRSSEHAIVQLPVGCGKTGTMALTPFHLSGTRTLVVTPNLEICETVARKLDYSTPECFYRMADVLHNGSAPSCSTLSSLANVSDCDEAAFVVTNIQQLVAGSGAKWLDQFSPDYFDLLLVDEGHHNVAESWQDVFDWFPDARVASFTATPLRADGQAIDGTRVYSFPIADAIREGYIRDLATRSLQPQSVEFVFRGSKRRHSLEEILELRDEAWFSKGVALAPECNKHIVESSIQCMNELRADGNVKHQTVASTCSIDHAKSVRALYAERGLDAEVLHSKMKDGERDRVRRKIADGLLDVVVQIQILGEGADYPSLGVAAIFRPFRHLVPYVQFIGRVMRTPVERDPRHPDNRAYIVAHVGLNVDRWWDELKSLDTGDERFFSEMAEGCLEFAEHPTSSCGPGSVRRRFHPEMHVLDEVIDHFVERGFLPEDCRALIDDVVVSLEQRGLSLESLGLTREDIEKRLTAAPSLRTGTVPELPVQPQRARQEARRRLDERVRSAAKEVLVELGFRVGGYQLTKLFPGRGTNNLSTAIILLNSEVGDYLGVGVKARDLLTTDQLRNAHDKIDDLVDRVVARVKGVLE